MGPIIYIINHNFGYKSTNHQMFDVFVSLKISIRLQENE